MSAERRQQLLDAVIAAPGDDDPRLVYADWLMEQNDPRGELISVQIALAKSGLDPRRRKLWRARSAELLAAHQQTWSKPAIDVTRLWSFRRGFIDEVSAEAPTFVRDAGKELMLVEPVRTLRLNQLNADRARALAAAPWLARIRQLELTGEIGDDGLAAILNGGHTRELRILNLHGCGLGPRAGTVLARWSGKLERLALNGNAIGDDGLRALADAACLSECVALYLTGTEISDEGVTALAASPNLTNLKTLSLNFNEGITDEALTALRDSATLKRLKKVETNACDEVSEAW